MLEKMTVQPGILDLPRDLLLSVLMIWSLGSRSLRRWKILRSIFFSGFFTLGLRPDDLDLSLGNGPEVSGTTLECPWIGYVSSVRIAVLYPKKPVLCCIMLVLYVTVQFSVFKTFGI